MKRRTFVGAATALTGASFLPGFANAQSKEIRMIESGGA